jgi:formamidase
LSARAGVAALTLIGGERAGAVLCGGSDGRTIRGMSEVRYYAAACQTAFDCPTSRDQIASRTKRMGEIIEQTIVGYEPFFDVRLLVFPEFAHAAPVYESVAKLREKLAVPVPNEHTDLYAKLAKKYGCYIQTGTFIEADPDWPDAVFNTTALIGPEGLLTKYRKVNPWIPWELHSSPHDVMVPSSGGSRLSA